MGKPGHGLAIAAGGSVLVQPGGDMYLTGVGDLALEGMYIDGHASISTIDGDIDNDAALEARALELNALGGSVGTKDDPFLARSEALSAQGESVYIRNLGSAQIGSITAEEDVALDVEGDVTAAQDRMPNVSASDITIRAQGDIGASDAPLHIVADAFHGSGKDIYLHNHSLDIELSRILAESLTVIADGNLTGYDIVTGDITIRADGAVGPLTFTASGSVDISSLLGMLNFRNLYRAPRAAKSVSFAYAHCPLVLALRLDVTIGDGEMALYLLFTLDAHGRIVLLAAFLGPRDAEAAFWMEALTALRDVLGVKTIDMVCIDGLAGFEEALRALYPQAALCDLSALGESEDEEARRREALCELLAPHVEEPEAVLDALAEFAKALPEATAELPEAALLDGEAFLAALAEWFAAYASESDAWADWNAENCLLSSFQTEFQAA